MITAERTTNDTGKFGLTQPPISQNAISMALAQPPGFTRNVHPREYIPTPNRHERRVQFGIDCAESVHFTHWEPGGEHVKQLVVKNVVMKTQKIKYKLPQTRYFSMEFPETMTLSAGMSWTVPITFRPVAKEGYNDVIEFTTTFGKFYLPIKATLPEHVLDFPSSTDFYLCPIRETARNVFLLKNVGELASYFEWATEKPFAITPRTGMLEPGGSVAVTIEFKPENASVYTAIAVCTFGDKDQWEKSKVTQAMTIEGIGKFSHLTIEGNVKEFDFGDVFVGHTAERKFVLVNSSAVHANFRIKQAERDTAPYFEFSTLSGTVAEGKSVEVTVTYTPVAAGMRSTDYFDITTLSGNTIRITCTGVGIGPKVTLNTKIINFNDVPAGTTVTRALYIQNNAATTAFYQFLTEPTSIFRIDKPWGTINPLSSVALTVKFSPMEPLNYWRRVYCLVEHQDGLYLDILGTCYNDKRRPATFFPKHIENYQKRKRNGLWSYGPEQLEEMIKSGAVKCENGVLSFTDPEQAAVHASLLLLDSPYETGRVGSEYFYENVGDREAVTLVDTYVDFGACSRYRVIESQFIRIANNTKGKMSCVWIMPGETTGEDPIFNVQPKTADIPPKTTFDFRVNFRPKMDNSFYGAQLECFVYFKSMRNFRLVNEDTFTPPWCLTPMVAGNTFPPGEDTFIPKINFGATRLDFPSCHVDKSVYRTVRVSNTGDTPVKFAILDGGSTGIGGGTALASAGGAAFSVKPRVGLLHKNESRLIVFRFSPSEQRIFEQALKCLFNSSSTNSYDLQMRGVGYYPQISFDTNNMLCFRPTCIGAVAKRPFTARNTSRISVHFEWHIPLQYASFVSIEPTSGTLLPNKTMDLMCTFAPNSAKNWVLKLPCYYSHETDGGQATQSHEGSPDFSNRRSTLTVVGQGTHGRVVADPSVINLDAILVNTIVERDLVLYNPCDCDVFYTLEIARRRGDLGERGEKDPAGEDGGEYTGDLMPGDDEEVLPNSVRGGGQSAGSLCWENRSRAVETETGLEIIQSTKVLPARSNQTLRVRVCLTEQLQHEFRIYYRLEESALDNGTWIRPMSRLLSRSLEQQRARRYHLCNIIALGVHPLVQVRDIRCEGFGKTFLWQLFSLDRFNDVLQAVGPDPRIHPADEDDSFPTDTGPLSNDQLGADTEVTSVNFDFGAAPVGCKPTVYHFSFMNTGVVSVDWVFQFPNDLEVEIEHWADPGDYTDEQMHHNLILDNNIFSISPKSGRLDPGESVHVIMTYSHEFAGQHKLPVVFKLRNGSSQLAGKEIMLNFAGYSVPPTKKCLHFHSTQHAFKPVSIGTEDPPVQSYQLTNRGPVSLEYYVDLSPLEKDNKRDNTPGWCNADRLDIQASGSAGL
ncbi:hypothetical protein HK104_000022 [Borealophlyctis nickersoniae]|nr:hypothetical protein HK104_000022 [Borealophlyctis nickersoniae]